MRDYSNLRNPFILLNYLTDNYTDDESTIQFQFVNSKQRSKKLIDLK